MKKIVNWPCFIAALFIKSSVCVPTGFLSLTCHIAMRRHEKQNDWQHAIPPFFCTYLAFL